MPPKKKAIGKGSKGSSEFPPMPTFPPSSDAPAASPSFLSRGAHNMPAEVFSTLSSCLPYKEQLGLATVDKGLRKAVLESMPRALYCCTQSSTLKPLPAIMPGLSELVVFLRTDQQHAELYRRARQNERRELLAQRRISAELCQKEEKEDQEKATKKKVEEEKSRKEVAKKCVEEEFHQCVSGIILRKSVREEDLFHLACLKHFRRLKKLAIVVEGPFNILEIIIRSYISFHTLPLWMCE